MKKYNIIGVMSGTSLDGLDIALCQFYKGADCWQAKIIAAETIKYSTDWKDKLWRAFECSGAELSLLNYEYGKFIGLAIKNFCKAGRLKADYVSSHGHTVFHKPHEGISVQIGHGAAIAAHCGLPVICDFRSLDVALGGQGAPLVPVADAQLFADYDYCLNLGGFANVSYNWYRHRIAYDICPANFVLNTLVSPMGLEYDPNGNEGRKGNICSNLLDALNKIDFYHAKPPKSLGREWIEACFNPVLSLFNLSEYDKLRTVYEHIAVQVSKNISNTSSKKVLITGGGANNGFLIDLIRNKTKAEICIPPKEIVEYKEALAFAFLGLLRLRNENNCMASVTGAKHDSVGGAVYWI